MGYDVLYVEQFWQRNDVFRIFNLYSFYSPDSFGHCRFAEIYKQEEIGSSFFS